MLSRTFFTRFVQLSQKSFALSRSRTVSSLVSWSSNPSASLFRNVRAFSTVVRVPSMGDSISEGTIADIPVKVGTAVNVDDVILVIETDKISQEVRTPVAGVIQEIKVRPQDNVKVGQELLVIGEGSSAPAAKPAPQPESKPTPAPQPATPSPAASVPPTTHTLPPPRKPLIQFRYGKRPAAPATTPAATPAAQPLTAEQLASPGIIIGTPTPAPSLAKLSSNAIFYSSEAELPAGYLKKRVFSERQMELIELGGAEPYPQKPAKGEKPKKK